MRNISLIDVFVQVNPLCKVPALQDGDLTLVRPASAQGTSTLTT